MNDPYSVENNHNNNNSETLDYINDIVLKTKGNSGLLYTCGENSLSFAISLAHLHKLLLEHPVVIYRSVSLA
jgi:hypothetical protein